MREKIIDASILLTAYPRRRTWTHKGERGRLLVVGGSKMYTGSTVFNCVAALRSGCDVVHLFSCQRAADIAASYLPDIISIPYAGTHFTPRQAKRVERMLYEYDALLIGGGLGLHPQTKKAVQQVLARSSIPTVVDADALRSLKGNTKCVRGKPFVLTPHANEFIDVSGTLVKDNVRDRVQKVKRIASSLNVVVLLKGAVDVISDGENVFLNTTGSPYMTKGGGGDCLAGVCASMLARNLSCVDAACAAAYVNGKAGENASKRRKESYLSSDLLDALARVVS